MYVSLSRATRINLSFSSTSTKKGCMILRLCALTKRRRAAENVPSTFFCRALFLLLSLFFSLSLHFSCVYLSVLLDSLITPSLLLDFTPPSSISFPFAPFNFIRSFLLHDVWCFAFVPVIRRKKRIIDRKCWSQMLNSSSARCSWALWESKCGGLRSLLSLIVPASNIVTRVFNFSLVTPLNVTLDRLNVGLKYFILIAKSYLLFNMLFY